MTGILEVLDASEDKLCYVCWDTFTPGPKPTDHRGLMFYNVCPDCKAKHPDPKELFKVRIHSMQERRKFLQSLPGDAGRFHRLIANQPQSLPSGALFTHNYKMKLDDESED